MTPIRSLVNRFSSSASSPGDADIVLGLPLESGDRTIYPVFLDPDASGESAAEPKQIGYLEISEGRSDFTSLEPDNRPLAIVPVLIIVALLVLWFVRRSR